MGQLQQAHKLLQQAAMEKQTDQAKYDSQFKIESMKADKEYSLKLEMQQREIAGKIEVARIGSRTASNDAQLEAQEERLALAVDSMDQAQGRAHDLNMLQAGQAGDAAASAQDHNEQILQQQHAADVAPPPPAPDAGMSAPA